MHVHSCGSMLVREGTIEDSYGEQSADDTSIPKQMEDSKFPVGLACEAQTPPSLEKGCKNLVFRGVGADLGGSIGNPRETGYLALADSPLADQQGKSVFPSNGQAAEKQCGALRCTSPERLGKLRPAECGTLNTGPHMQREDDQEDMKTRCAFLGGGKRGRSEDMDILDDDNCELQQHTTPGHLQNGLLILQARALEAIEALPVDCRDALEFGMVETRIWGLEAMKHVLRMRLALQSTLQLRRPVDTTPVIPPANELLAANLTLNIHNKGNRCFANSVLRMWCWMGAMIAGAVLGPLNKSARANSATG